MRVSLASKPGGHLRWRRSASRVLLTSALGALSFLLLLIAAVVGLGGTSALANMAADELSASGTLLGALCAAPVVALVGLAYWRLARRAGEPLLSGNRI